MRRINFYASWWCNRTILRRRQRIDRMKRPPVTALIIGILIAGAVGLLHALQLLSRVEVLAQQFVSEHTITKVIGEQWQYILMSILSVGVAWMTLTSSRPSRLAWLPFALLLELSAFTWIASLYHVFLQPLPLMFAVVLAFVVSERFSAIYRRSPSRVAG